MAPENRRVMIIGLDGATLDLIRPWAEAGKLPALNKIMRRGAWGPLRTIIPPITPAAWSSFLTGMNPGKHGIFDFTAKKSDQYETCLVNASRRDAPSLWQILSNADRRVIVHNVPITYPPEKVNGVMVSGLLTPAGAEDATWPRNLQEEIKRVIPEFNFSPPGMYSRGRDVQFVKSVLDLNETTLQVISYLKKMNSWDFLVTIFQGTDIMSHFMWKHMASGGDTAPEPIRDILANAILTCYQDVDRAIAELSKDVGEDVYIIVMSDHGFGAMDSYMSVNAWLIERGYIKFKRNPLSLMRRAMFRLGLSPLKIYGYLLASGIADLMREMGRKNINQVQRWIQSFFLSFKDVDWSRTRAYSMGYGGPIFVNLKGREPQGIVEPGDEYDSLLNELTANLRNLREPISNEPFVGAIHYGRELFSGPHTDQAPDLYFIPRDPKYAGLGLAEFHSSSWLSTSPDRSGHHRMDGVLMISGPGIREGYELRTASIMDIAPTVLALMGVPIPTAMDGDVLEEAMTDELCKQRKIRFIEDDERGPHQLVEPEISEQDEETIRMRLHELGYIG
jgi:predicted AlkP superfamily phosphohydrolase/phosphomutase